MGATLAIVVRPKAVGQLYRPSWCSIVLRIKCFAWLRMFEHPEPIAFRNRPGEVLIRRGGRSHAADRPQEINPETYGGTRYVRFR
jgi:hypothetical protein